MVCRAWFPLVVLFLLLAPVLSGQADEKQPSPRVATEITDMEFELKKLALEVQMAEFGVKEAELALDRVDLQRLRAQATNDKHEVGRLHVDRQEAELHIEMRKLAKQVASLELEQAHVRLKRLKKPAKASSALDGPVQVELLEDSNVVITRGKTEDVRRVVALLEELGGNVEAEQPMDKEQAATIEALIEQRRGVLQSMLDAVVLDFRAGKAIHADVVRATESMIAAELELASDKEKRIALRERRLKGLKELEDLTKAQHDIGKVGITEVLAAKDARIKAEIELLRERAGTE